MEQSEGPMDTVASTIEAPNEIKLQLAQWFLRTFEECGRRTPTDDGAYLYYKLTHEPG